MSKDTTTTTTSTTNELNIATLIEDIRTGILTLIDEIPIIDEDGYTAVAHAFDRAVARTLVKHFTGGGQQDSQKQNTRRGWATVKPSPHGKLRGAGKADSGRGPAAGSQTASDRAKKAWETRKANAAARGMDAEAEQPVAGGGV